MNYLYGAALFLAGVYLLGVLLLVTATLIVGDPYDHHKDEPHWVEWQALSMLAWPWLIYKGR